MILDDYHKLPTEALVDLLAVSTEKFTQLMADKEYSQEYEETKGTIQLIQRIIASRQTVSEPNITFTQPDSTV